MIVLRIIVDYCVPEWTDNEISLFQALEKLPPSAQIMRFGCVGYVEICSYKMIGLERYMVNIAYVIIV